LCISILFLFACSKKSNWKQFLLDNPTYKLYINGRRITEYDDMCDFLHQDYNNIIGIKINRDYNYCVESQYSHIASWIPNTNIGCIFEDNTTSLYLYEGSSITIPNRHYCKIKCPDLNDKDDLISVKKEESKKEKSNMWNIIGLIILIFIIAKIAPTITRKLVFRKQRNLLENVRKIGKNAIKKSVINLILQKKI
jgi:hypothetical protein